MQSLHPETGKNKSVPNLPIPGITLSESWRSAFGKLSAGCLSDARAVILIGERGVGKSSLIESWKEVSSSTFHAITLEDATGEPDQVVADLANLLGVDTADLGRGAILNAIADAVETLRKSGKETVVIVPDADRIPANTIELLMVLSRFRGSGTPLLRYMFSGTDDLRKTMRLDGSTSRRQNNVVVELERFNPEQTKAFAIANLARNSNTTISEDAASYLHESTSGKPANILSVLDKVQNGRMSEDETEITRDHIQSLVKAPTPIKSMGPNGSGNVTELAAVHPSDPASPDGTNGAEAPSAIDQTEPIEGNGAAPRNGVGSNAELPDSIRNVNDPRPLLRWAFGLEEHSETEALAKRATMTSPESAGGQADAQSANEKSGANSADLNAALAKVTQREKAERSSSVGAASEKSTDAPQRPTLVANPDLTQGGAAGGAGALRADSSLRADQSGAALDQMIQAESFAFEDKRPTAAAKPVENPYELNDALREVPVQRPRRTKKLLFAAGFAALGIGAFGLLWNALDPRRFANPEVGVSGGQVASVASQQAEASLALAAKEPDLTEAIALLKLPSLDGAEVVSPTATQAFRERGPRVIPASYLTPTSVENTSENFGLRQTIVADMAESERIGLAGEERRLMERLESLGAEVADKQNTLDGLERAISAIAYQAKESSEVLDNRSAEIEVVTSRLAFMARDRAQAAQRLEAVTRDAASAEANLIRMRDELSAAEEQIAQNEAILNQNQTTTANLDETLARRSAEIAAISQKVEETESLLETRRTELADVLAQQESAKSELATLKEQLEQTKASQVEVESDLVRLISERNDQIEASNVVSANVQAADEKLAAAQAELEAADKSLAEKSAAYAAIESKSAIAESQLEELQSQLAKRESLIATANAELETLQNERLTLEGNLTKMAAEINQANNELAKLANVEQSSSVEFKDLEARREALNAELQEGNAELNKLSGELTKKQREVVALSEELNEGASAISKQQSELSDLKTETEAVVAAQATAKDVVAVEQEQVARASTALAELKARQEELTASLAKTEEMAVAAQDELRRIEDTKSRAELEISETSSRLREIKAEEGNVQRQLASYTNEISAKEARLNELEQRISASNKQLEVAAKKRQDLNAQLAALSTEGTGVLRERNEELSFIEAELDKKRTALAEISQELDKRAVMLDEGVVLGSDDNLALSTLASPLNRVNEQPVEVEAPQDVAAVQVPRATTQPEVAEATIASGGVRDASVVISALEDAPGLGRVTAEKKEELLSALVRGECVTDALKATFGRVNPHTLVALLENMEMCGS